MDTVCIIAHHTGNLIEKCLKSLPIDPQSIIVATSTKTIYLPYRTLNFNRNEPTYKRNKASYCGFTNNVKYLCYLDDDVEVALDCISEMEKYLDNNKDVGMVYAMLFRTGYPIIKNTVGEHSYVTVDTAGSWLSKTGFLIENYIPFHTPQYILSAKSACCMIRKDLFFRVGKFDEDFVIYAEETDLSWRVWQAGYKVVMLPQAIAYHNTQKPPEYYNKQYIHYHGCKNYITMLIKNLEVRNFYIVFINAFIWFMVGMMFLFKNRKASKWIFEGILYNIINLPYIWKKRKKIQRNYSDKELFKYIMAKPNLRYYYQRLWDYWVHELHRKSS